MKCEYCDSDWEYIILVEDDENPIKSRSMLVCSEHMHEMEHAIIVSWTKAEWLSEE